MLSMFNARGQRKYLTPSERLAFLHAAELAPPTTMTFCLTLAHSGARISEVLALKPDRIDRSAQLIIIESLKKRRRGVFRAVPIPMSVLDALDAHHDLESGHHLWPWCRTTAWSRVKEVLAASGAPASVRMPKALRHGFGIAGVRRGVPLNMVQKWLGHANIATTAIYTDAIGEEELALAARLWESSA